MGVIEVVQLNIYIRCCICSNSRGQSPCRSPLLCPSPDSTEGRTTPKFYISKLCTANTNSSSSHSSSLSAAPSPNSSSAMEIPIDLPNLCTKVTNSDVNSDLECCSDVDLDCDSQNKLHTDEKFTTQKRDEACEKLKKLFFTRVSTDSVETDCSFKSQPNEPNDGSGSSIGESQNATDNICDNKSDSMECDSSKKLPSSDGFCIVQNVVSSTVDIDVIAGAKEREQQPPPPLPPPPSQQQQQQLEHCPPDDHSNNTVTDDDVIVKCVPNDKNDEVCGSVSVADVDIDPNIPIETQSIENST